MPNSCKFTEIGLSSSMVEALKKKGFEELTPIQALTIPFLLNNKQDIIGQAQTGTGKTGAFGIGLLELIAPKSGAIKGLIMTPTRELALQVTEELNSLAIKKRTKIIAIYGGQSIEGQISKLKSGVDIVVGTPGRILDHLERKTLDLSQIEYVVLDEADEMLNMGFIEDIETILKTTPSDKRMLLFSATMPPNIMKLAKKYMGDYEILSIKKDQLTQNNIQQIYFEVALEDKFEALHRIIDVEEQFYGMVFCRTKVDADNIAAKLSNRGCRAEALHGDISQIQREKILQKFRNKKITILVATDVAARGIDVDNLTHVINFTPPQDPESYVHRIGRTGRAGKSGTAITLITPSEYRGLLSIQKVANATITRHKLPAVKEVIASKKNRVKTMLNGIIASEELSGLKEMASEMLANNQPEEIIAALLKYTLKDELNEDSYSEIADLSDRRNNKNYGAPKSRNSEGYSRKGYVDNKGIARLFVAKGRNDGMTPAKIAKLIESQSGVKSSKIGDIRVLENFSFVTAPFIEAEKILRSFEQPGSRSLISYAKEKR